VLKCQVDRNITPHVPVGQVGTLIDTACAGQVRTTRANIDVVLPKRREKQVEYNTANNITPEVRPSASAFPCRKPRSAS
jgi:hypothetical protein